MTHLTPELVRTLTAQAPWVAGPNADRVVERLELMLAWTPAPVRSLLLDELIAAPDRARVLLQGFALASTAGALPVDVIDERTVEMRDHEGAPFALIALATATSAWPNGDPEDVARLTAALDSTFQGRQYALYLRRVVPPDFNPAPVARAVHLWLAAIDRGEWKGRHAIYEDDQIALELTLVQQHATRGGGRLMTVGPVTALERLAAIDGMVVEIAQRHGQVDSPLPLVVALGANPSWRVPRGYVEQLLYGTADWVEATSSPEGSSYTAQFRANGRSLFSDPVCRSLCALWWLESDPAVDARVDPLAFRGWGHDNPWCDALARIPPVDIPRFVAQVEAPAAAEDAWAVDRERPVLTWTRAPGHRPVGKEGA